MEKDKFVVSCGGIPSNSALPLTESNLTAREWNCIIGAVNCRKTPEEAGLKTEKELRHYRNIWAEAEELFVKYGNWPVFDLVELEW